MNCIYLKQKLNRNLECKKQNKAINLKECNGCKFKEYNKANSKMRARTYKQSKLERNRNSVFTNDMNHCIICGCRKDHLHEIYFGKNRANSIKYNLVIPLCSSCHTEMHNNKEWQDYWHKKGQVLFMKTYPNLNFLEIFKKNYL
jgi:hypothetical protein